MRSLYFFPLALLLLPACDMENLGGSKDPAYSLEGLWLLESRKVTSVYEDQILDIEQEYFTTTDFHTIREIKYFSEDSTGYCQNEIFSSGSRCAFTHGYRATADKFISTQSSDDDTSSYEQSANRLIITDVYTATSGGSVFTETTVEVYIEYTGDYPPEGWTSPVPDDDFEPDSLASLASPVTVDGLEQERVLYPRDIDWAYFVADSGTGYRIETSGDIDPFLSLYSDSGITLIDDDDDDGPSVNARIDWTAGASGIYHILVRGAAPAVSGFYGLSVSTNPAH